MADEPAAVADTTETAPSFDMGAAVDSISADLFPEPGAPSEPAESVEAKAETPPADPPTKTIPTIRPAPKSWAKDTHELWGKIDPKAQEYIEKREKDFLDGLEQYKGHADYAKQIREVLGPFEAHIKAQGSEPHLAIKALLNAQYRLTAGTLQERQAAYQELGQKLGFPHVTSQSNGQVTETPADPRIAQLEQQFQQMRDALTAQQHTALQAAREKASQEVAAFASEKGHELFDECAEDIIKFIQAGDALQEAYDKAVWANPVTRLKSQQAYFAAETEKAKERARLEALPKHKAKSVNVQSKDTQRQPTEPLGSLDETLRSTMNAIKERETVH